MMLGDVTLPIDYATASGLALVFSQPLAQRLAEIHAVNGSSKCVPLPGLLMDGRLFLPATVLTEVMPGGLLHAMWEAADKSVLAQAVEVMPMADAVSMLAPDPRPSLP